MATSWTFASDDQFQSVSSKHPSLSPKPPMVAAMLDVSTIFLTEPEAMAAFVAASVPSTAGAMSCRCGSSIPVLLNGDAVWKSTSAPATQGAKPASPPRRSASMSVKNLPLFKRSSAMSVRRFAFLPVAERTVPRTA